MNFAISVHRFVGDDGFDPGAFCAHMWRAEELRYQSAWTQEQILGSARTLAPLEALTMPPRARNGSGSGTW